MIVCDYIEIIFFVIVCEYMEIGLFNVYYCFICKWGFFLIDIILIVDIIYVVWIICEIKWVKSWYRLIVNMMFIIIVI